MSTPHVRKNRTTEKPKQVGPHEDLSIIFHHLWTKCVGTTGYDKRAWMSVRKQISNIGIDL